LTADERQHDDQNRALAAAVEHHRAGRLREAEAIYRRILAQAPRNAEALHHLGLIAASHGKLDEADDLMSAAEAEAPGVSGWLLNHGKVAAMRGDFAAAERLFAGIPSDDPRRLDACIALAKVLLQLGRPEEARARLREVESAGAERPDFLVARAFAEQALGLPADAERSCRDAVRLALQWPDAHAALGMVLRLQGRTAEAETAFRQVLTLVPDHIDALLELGSLCNTDHRPEEALGFFERLLALRPGDRQARFGWATALISAGRTREGRGALDELTRDDPRDWRARWARLLSFPKAYGSDDEIARERERFSDDLAQLTEDVGPHLATDLPAILDAVSSATDFYLHYTGGDVRDLQERYGRLISRIARAAYPDHAKSLTGSRGQRIRVGFASSNLYRHSVMKSHGCWITDLPRDRFEITVFRLGGLTDDWTDRLRKDARWIDCAGLDQKSLIERIGAEKLDALIWLDIGMDALVQVPAALRLAPVQATGFGHPVTSGLASIDAWLTGDLMEPNDGERHYSERLVRLPNLSVSYPWPDRVPGAVPDEVRALKESGRTVYVCAQSLFKLLPLQDEAIARIARAVPDAAFVFITHPSPAITDIICGRLTQRLAVDRIAAEGRIVFLPRLSEESFLALNQAADVVLDSLGWSGFNSTLEALAMGAPVVTMPGDTMRAHHTHGILTLAGLSELIAPDLDGYVQLAARLGLDPEFRQAMRVKVTERTRRAFDDPAPVSALAEWLERAVADTQP
jgi:predicted O-linked N-acetylglucosamine transferase (SPINDLY family)